MSSSLSSKAKRFFFNCFFLYAYDPLQRRMTYFGLQSLQHSIFIAHWTVILTKTTRSSSLPPIQSIPILEDIHLVLVSILILQLILSLSESLQPSNPSSLHHTLFWEITMLRVRPFTFLPAMLSLRNQSLIGETQHTCDEVVYSSLLQMDFSPFYTSSYHIRSPKIKYFSTLDSRNCFTFVFIYTNNQQLHSSFPYLCLKLCLLSLRHLCFYSNSIRIEKTKQFVKIQ